jgi:mannose-6-phosphate isomerase-like protein (cupin superfamily)
VALILARAGAPTPAPGGVDWVEHHRSDHLSVGTYALAEGAVDDQTPHREDEIYVVTSGRARFVADPGPGPAVDEEVRIGSVIFVGAGELHHFTDATDDFATVVVFAPPESG